MSWQCTKCSRKNPSTSAECISCGAQRRGPPSVSSASYGGGPVDMKARIRRLRNGVTWTAIGGSLAWAILSHSPVPMGMTPFQVWVYVMAAVAFVAFPDTMLLRKIQRDAAVDPVLSPFRSTYWVCFQMDLVSVVTSATITGLLIRFPFVGAMVVLFLPFLMPVFYSDSIRFTGALPTGRFVAFSGAHGVLVMMMGAASIAVIVGSPTFTIALSILAATDVVAAVVLMREPTAAGGGTSSVKCGGCGSDNAIDLQIVRDKNNNQGFLCSSCRHEYASLLAPASIRRFWMCGACGYRVLAGTRIDDAVGPASLCQNCGADVNTTLVNLSNDRPVASGQFGQPIG